MQSPHVESSGSSWINVAWEAPLYPNGEITGYVLYHEQTELYSGGLNTFNYTGLQVRSTFYL